MPEVRNDDVTLFCEVEGEGEPVTVFAHGLTNNRNELGVHPAPARDQGAVRLPRPRPSSPADPKAFRFEDFARDLDAVANAFGATVAVGTSLGAGAIGNLCRVPERFQRMVWLLPAGLDLPFGLAAATTSSRRTSRARRPRRRSSPS